MTGPHRNVFQELDALSVRLTRIEQALGLLAQSRIAQPESLNLSLAAPGSQQAAPVQEMHAQAPEPGLQQVQQPPPLPDAEDLEAYRKYKPVIPTTMSAVEKRPTAFAHNRHRPFDNPEPVKEKVAGEFERLIGGRWYAVVGAIIVMIGMVLFLKLAYQEGWLKLISGGFKCAIGAAFGLAMVVAGEIAFRKLEKGKQLAAAALTATGLGAMYAAAYAAHAVYDLFGLTVCFVILAAVSAGAIALAIRQKIATVGLLGLLGAYMAPFLMSTDKPSRVTMPLYLLLLLVSGLILSLRMGPRIKSFYTLRTMVWWGTLVVGSLWAVSMRQVAPQLVLLWAPVVWILIHAELVLWARSFKLPQREADVDDESASVAQVPQILVVWSTARAYMTSFSSTAWCIIISLTSLYAWKAMGGPVGVGDWLVPAVAAVATGVLGFMLSGHLRVLKDPPRNVAEQLGISLLTQCAAALVTAMILGVSGWAEPASLIGLGVAAAVAARWARMRGLNVYAAGSLLVGTIRIFWLGGGSLAFGGALGISELAFLSCLAGGGWMTLAILMRPSIVGPYRAVYAISVLGGCFAWSVAALDSEATASAVIMLSTSVASSLISRKLNSVAFRYAGLWLIATESVRMLTFDYRDLANVPEDIAFTLNGFSPAIGLTFMTWAILPAIASIVWFVHGDGFVRLRAEVTDSKSATERGVGIAAIAAGLVMICATSFSPESSTAGFAMFWGLVAVISSLLAFVLPRYLLGIAAAPIAAIAILTWCVAWIGPFPGWDSATARWALLIHYGMITAIVVSAASVLCVGSIWAHRSKKSNGNLIKVSGVILAGLILFVASSEEAARIAGELSNVQTAQRAGVSIWWGIVGTILIAAGFMHTVAIMRHVGLGLISLAVGKALLIDLVGVPPAWRVFSFVGLGLMMLGVSVAYAKLGQRLSANAKTESP